MRIGLATLSDHKLAERRLKEAEPKRERKVFYVVNIPVPSAQNGLGEAPFPYFLPTFETHQEAQAFRREAKLEGYAIKELVVERG